MTDTISSNIETTNTLLTTTEQSINNLILAENRPTLEETTMVSETTVSNNLSETIDENQWSLLSLASRPSIIQRGIWSASQFSPFIAELPATLAQSSAYWTTLFNTFAFARFDMNVKVQVNTTRFHTGKLCITWNPLSTYKVGGISGDPLIWRATQLPHIIIDASMSNVATLSIPFQHYLDNLPLTKAGSHSLGSINVIPLTPLIYADGTTPKADYTVWFWLSNIKMHTPIPAHNLFDNPSFQSGFLEQKAMQVREIGKTASDCISSAAKTFNGIKSFVEIADSPSMPVTANRTLLSNNNLAHGKCPSTHIRMSVDPISGVTPDSADNPTNTDEMHLSNIVKVPSFIRNEDLLSSNSWTMAVSPTLVCSDEPNWYPSFLGYLSQRFRFWRGGIRFRFDFLCSNFHTGRFMVNFIPNVDTDTVLDVVKFVNYPTMVMDLQEKHTFEMIVPYTATSPWKIVPPYHPVEKTANDFNKFIGNLTFNTLNNITYPSSVAPYCHLWIYISGADDFEFAVPFMQNKNPDTFPAQVITSKNFVPDPPTPPRLKTEPISEDSPGEHVEKAAFYKSYLDSSRSNITDTSNVLNNSSSTSTLRNPIFNEDFMNMKNLISRQTLSTVVRSKDVEKLQIVIPNTPQKRLNYYTERTYFPSGDLVAYFSKLYIFWRGSTRISITSNIPRIEFVMISSTVMYDDVPFSDYESNRTIRVYRNNTNDPFQYKTIDYQQAAPAHQSSGAMQPNVELEIPYYSMFRKLPVDIPKIVSEAYPERTHYGYAGQLVVGYANLLPDFTHNFHVYTSAAPDFQFFTLGACPIVERKFNPIPPDPDI